MMPFLNDWKSVNNEPKILHYQIKVLFCIRMSKKENITSEQFELVFKEMHSQLFYLAYDIVGDRDVAQDMVSEVFVSLWKSHRDVSFEKLRGYLYISVRNHSLDWYRHNSGVRNIPIEELSNLVSVDDSWQERERRIRKIEEAMDQMSEKTRLIFDLCYRKRKSYREAAEIVGISAEGIKKQLQRALRDLRGRLKGEN